MLWQTSNTTACSGSSFHNDTCNSYLRLSQPVMVLLKRGTALEPAKSLSIMIFCILLTRIFTTVVALTYFQLAVEDWRWWWRSFMCGGSTGLFVFGSASLTFSSCKLIYSSHKVHPWIWNCQVAHHIPKNLWQFTETRWLVWAISTAQPVVFVCMRSTFI